jgi:hypothetical protein
MVALSIPSLALGAMAALSIPSLALGAMRVGWDPLAQRSGL